MPRQPWNAQFERRKHQRHKASGKGHLRALKPEPEDAIEVEVIEESDSGLAFRCSVALASGTAVQLRFEHQFLMGEVRYCEQEPDGRFRMGVRVDDTTPFK